MLTSRFGVQSFHPEEAEVRFGLSYGSIGVARFTGPHAKDAAAGLIGQLERAVDTWVESFEGAERL